MKKSLIGLLAVLAILAGVATNQLFDSDFTTIDNKNYRWQDLKGRWVVVNYFAPWCAPCLREIPELNRFYQKHIDMVVMLGLSFDNLDSQELKELQVTYDINYPVIEKIRYLPWLQAPKTLPHTIIIDPKGTVVKYLKGEQTADSLLTAIKALHGP